MSAFEDAPTTAGGPTRGDVIPDRLNNERKLPVVIGALCNHVGLFAKKVHVHLLLFELARALFHKLMRPLLHGSLEAIHAFLAKVHVDDVFQKLPYPLLVARPANHDNLRLGDNLAKLGATDEPVGGLRGVLRGDLRGESELEVGHVAEEAHRVLVRVEEGFPQTPVSASCS